MPPLLRRKETFKQRSFGPTHNATAGVPYNNPTFFTASLAKGDKAEIYSFSSSVVP